MTDTSLPCPRCGATDRFPSGPCRPCRRVWYEAHREQIQARQQQYNVEHPEVHRAASLRYMARTKRQNVVRDRTPGMVAAHNAVRLAVRSGRLERPDHCELCGVSCRPDAAHHDYAEPLRVRWLCRRCHIRWDMADPKSARQEG